MAATKPPKQPAVQLVPQDIPGVFKNRAGVLVNDKGVALSLADLQKRDEEHIKSILEDGPTAYRTPAEFLRSVAFDPRQPLHVRVNAANKAAPFFSPKLNAFNVFGALTDEQLAQLAADSAKGPADAHGANGAGAAVSSQAANPSSTKGRPKQAKPGPRPKQ